MRVKPAICLALTQCSWTRSQMISTTWFKSTANTSPESDFSWSSSRGSPLLGERSLPNSDHWRTISWINLAFQLQASWRSLARADKTVQIMVALGLQEDKTRTKSTTNSKMPSKDRGLAYQSLSWAQESTCSDPKWFLRRSFLASLSSELVEVTWVSKISLTTTPKLSIKRFTGPRRWPKVEDQENWDKTTRARCRSEEGIWLMPKVKNKTKCENKWKSPFWDRALNPTRDKDTIERNRQLTVAEHSLVSLRAHKKESSCRTYKN